MRKLTLIFITVLLALSAVAVWAGPLLTVDTCCDDCGGDEDGDCCTDFACCHSGQAFAFVHMYSSQPTADLVVSRADQRMPVVAVGQFDLSLDLPPRTISL